MYQNITALPQTPDRLSDGDLYLGRAGTFLAALPTLKSELDGTGSYVESWQQELETDLSETSQARDSALIDSNLSSQAVIDAQSEVSRSEVAANLSEQYSLDSRSASILSANNAGIPSLIGNAGKNLQVDNNETAVVLDVLDVAIVGDISRSPSGVLAEPEWLYCNGNAYDEDTYYQLSTVLGSGTLPSIVDVSDIGYYIKSGYDGTTIDDFILGLFSGGTNGIWLDPSDLTTLFQDTAGTIPVALDGDPVGLVLDKSGNGNHASQSISASRPTYRTDGILHWLEFDGIDDYLVTGVIDFSASDEMSMTFGLLKLANTSTRDIVGLSENPFLNSGTFILSSFIDGRDFRYGSIGSGGAASMISSTTLPDFSISQSIVVSGASKISQDNVNIRVNKASYQPSALDQGLGNYGEYPLFIGGRGGLSNFYEFGMYGMVVADSLTSNSTAETVERYIARKSGVML